MRALFYKFNPAVPQQWLVLLAGILWTSVGTFLCTRAFAWIVPMHQAGAYVYIASGAVVALIWNRFMFTRIAHRNLFRISQLPQRACVFAFTAWRGYAMIAGMSVLGILLRNSAVPKEYLAVLYTAMGGSLVLSSGVFYRRFWKLLSVGGA